MEIRQLLHLVALAEEGSFTAAARREGIVQSGLSSSIQALEHDVGAVLYERSTRPVRLTASGLALVESARPALAELELGRLRAQDAAGALRGPFRVGLTDPGALSAACPFLGWLAGFVAAHPAVVVHASQPRADEALTRLAGGELDCAVVTTARERASAVRMRLLSFEPVALVCAATHPLAARRAVGLSDLADQPFVDLADGEPGGHEWDRLFADRGFGRRVTCAVADLTMVRELVAAGIGIGFVPAAVASDPRLRVVRLVEELPGQALRFALPLPSRTNPAAAAFDVYVSERLGERSAVDSPSRMSVEI